MKHILIANSNLALLSLNRIGFALENMEREDSILQWKNQVHNLFTINWIVYIN